MNRNLLIAVVVLVLIGGGVLLMNQQQSQQAPVPTQTAEPTDNEESNKTEDKMEKEDDAMAKASVEIKGFAFNPKTITIKKGESITFTNKDSVGHSATSDDGVFDTGLLEQNESASVKFDKAGTYAYHCTPHPNMKATIVVQ